LVKDTSLQPPAWTTTLTPEVKQDEPVLPFGKLAGLFQIGNPGDSVLRGEWDRHSHQEQGECQTSGSFCQIHR
jgi:hypothetical protein